jgi:hypothetical protein
VYQYFFSPTGFSTGVESLTVSNEKVNTTLNVQQPISVPASAANHLSLFEQNHFLRF